MASSTLITGGRVITPAGALDGATVLVEGGRVAAVGPCPPAFPGEVVDVAGAWVAPGLIETHVHGAREDDVMDARPEALAAIGRHLATRGVTAWLPTTVACPAEQLERILAAVAGAMADAERADAVPTGAQVLGAHLESSFLAPKYKGAQPAEWLRAPDDAELRDVIGRHRAAIRVVTLAPELPGSLALIHALAGWGIVVAVGHSDATFEEVRAAVQAGARRVTHLCNAQRPFHHREPGVVGAALVSDELYVEVIGDLVHVHPAGLEMARRCKGADRLMLVSDALRGSGLAPGTYELGGQPTVLDGRSARLLDGTIAGSVVSLDQALANVVGHTRATPAEAFAMASATPAASLGLRDRGALVPGLRADLAVFDADFGCRATMVGGRWVYRR